MTDAGRTRGFTGAGRPVLPGITGRLEFADAPGHVEDLKRYRARGYAMAGNRIRIVTTDRSQPSRSIRRR